MKEVSFVRVSANGTEKIVAIPDDPTPITTIVDGEEVPAFVDEDKLMMIPDRSSPQYLEAAPLEPVVAGSQSVKINCDDLAKFKAGDVIVFSPGTAQTEVARLEVLVFPKSVCYQNTTSTNAQGCWSWQLQRWRGLCDANFGGPACDTWVCEEAIATTVSASIRPRNVHATGFHVQT